MKRETITTLYGMLVCLMVLALGIAYAQVVTELKIEGKTEGEEQDGVYITEVEYLTNSGADTTNSKINFFKGTMLDSKVVLGSSTSSSITYKVTIKNNTDREQVFIGIVKDETNEEVYSNTSIQPNVETAGGITGLEEYVTTIAPGEYITFPVTYAYAGTDTSHYELQGKINFRFREKPILELSNEGETYTLENIGAGHEEEYEFTVSNYNETYTNGVQLTYTFATELTEGSPLEAKIYDSEGNEVTESISIEGDGTVVDHTYTLKIEWDSSINGSEYQAKQYECNVKLIATPDDTKYLDYTIEKEFNIDITTECKSYVVEYIESTGTQYIDTGIVPDSNTEFELSISLNDTSNTLAIMGARHGNLVSPYFNMWIMESNKFRWDYYTSRTLVEFTVSEDTKVVITRAGNNTSFESNGNTVTMADSTTAFTTPYTMYLFNVHQDTEETRLAKMKLYYFKLYQNDALVRDFIPALDDNGVACLYDKVTEQYFYNSGTGTFNYSEIEIDHAFGDWEITTPATCVATGTKTRTCAQCGKVETEEIAIDTENGHNYVNKVCTLCGDNINTAPVITHNYDYTSSKTTSSFTIRMRATDAEGDSLTYELFYSDTSASGPWTSVGTATATASSYKTITKSSLSEYTDYWWYITVTDGTETVTSDVQQLRTYCSGTGSTCTATLCTSNRTQVACTACDGGQVTNDHSGYWSQLSNTSTYVSECSFCGDNLDGKTAYCVRFDCLQYGCMSNNNYNVCLDCFNNYNSVAPEYGCKTDCSVCEGDGYTYSYTSTCSTHGISGQHYYCNKHTQAYVGTSSSHTYCSHGYVSQHE